MDNSSAVAGVATTAHIANRVVARQMKRTKRKDQVLFIDARHIFRQIDRAHRDWTPDQVEFLSNIVRLFREEDVETEAGSRELMNEKFPAGKYTDVPGLCKIATLAGTQP